MIAFPVGWVERPRDPTSHGARDRWVSQGLDPTYGLAMTRLCEHDVVRVEMSERAGEQRGPRLGEPLDRLNDLAPARQVVVRGGTRETDHRPLDRDRRDRLPVAAERERERRAPARERRLLDREAARA